MRQGSVSEPRTGGHSGLHGDSVQHGAPTRTTPATGSCPVGDGGSCTGCVDDCGGPNYNNMSQLQTALTDRLDAALRTRRTRPTGWRR